MSEPSWEILGGGGAIGGPIDYVGNWAAGTTYQPGQIVRYNGVDYLAVNSSLGQTPPPVAALALPGLVKLWDSSDAGVVFPTASIVTPSLPQTYSHLRVLATFISTIGNNGGTLLRLNGDTGNNYYWNELQGRAGNVSDVDGQGVSSINLGNAGGFASGMAIDFPFYRSQVGNGGKTVLSMTNYVASLAAGNHYTQWVSALWQQNVAISTLTFISGSPNFAAGTRIGVYGVL